MPVHDWTRVPAATFHDFHQAWINELRNALNASLLSEGYYALAEQVTVNCHADVTLEDGDPAYRLDATVSRGSGIAADHWMRRTITASLRMEPLEP